MKPWVAILIGAVLIVIGVFVFSQTEHRLAGPSVSGLTVSTSTISASTTGYTVDAQYPQFGISSIDSQIKATVEKGVSDLEARADQEKPAENGFPLYSFASSFGDTYMGSDYISVSLVLADYTGGAHENPIIVGATYDRATGKPVTLDQALALTGMSLQQVASSSKKQLAANPDTSPTGMWASGSDPSPDNYQTFLINQNNVVFIFQPYQVAPYAAGAPEVSIPRIK